MREIILDCETTGVEVSDGDRIVSIGCVELIDGQRTGLEQEWYCNPQGRKVGDSVQIHGLTDAFLSRQLWFADHWPEIADVIGDARLVIHNAPFDVAFLNAEFRRMPDPRPSPIAVETVTDTLVIARQLFGTGQGALDKLITRFKIGTKSSRGKHGALKDAILLAEVYAELRVAQQGGRQRGLDLDAPDAADHAVEAASEPVRPVRRPFPRSRLTPDEQARHAAFVASLGPAPVWNDYLGKTDAQEAA